MRSLERIVIDAPQRVVGEETHGQSHTHAADDLPQENVTSPVTLTDVVTAPTSVDRLGHSHQGEKTTTPMPSLNKDSPRIWASRAFGAPSCFSISITAIGSVGEMSAPRLRQTTIGRGHADRVRRSAMLTTPITTVAEQHRDGRQRGDRPFVHQQLVDVQAEGSGEQEEAEQDALSAFD